jgi:hypothetical protein
MAFTRVQDWNAVGIGAKVANTWLGRLFDRLPVYYAAKLATYVIYQVNRSVGGCGLGTDVLMLPRVGPPQYVPDALVRKWEDIFRGYATLERSVFYYCIGVESERVFRTKLGKEVLSKGLDSFREALTQSDEQMLKGLP